MTPTDYLANRFRDLAAKVAENAKRPTLTAHPYAREIARRLDEACNHLDGVAALLTWEEGVAQTPAPVTGQAAPTPAESPASATAEGFIASGRNGFAGPIIFALDENGDVWAGGTEGLRAAHRFPTREAADRIANTRGGYAVPMSAA